MSQASSVGVELPEALEPALFDGGASIMVAECALPAEACGVPLCLLSHKGEVPLPDALPAGSDAFRYVAPTLLFFGGALTTATLLSSLLSHASPFFFLCACVRSLCGFASFASGAAHYTSLTSIDADAHRHLVTPAAHPALHARYAAALVAGTPLHAWHLTSAKRAPQIFVRDEPTPAIRRKEAGLFYVDMGGWVPVAIPPKRAAAE